MGREELNGKRLLYPTGRYAASIQFKREGAASISVVADEDVAPEAAILESGHGPVDLKTKFEWYRGYPMHRLRTGADSPRRIGAGPPSMKPSMWAEIRAQESTGFASIGPNSSPDSWIIPAMTPYAPALTIAAMMRSMLKGA
ncbi:MAG: hypothetical protein KGL35_01730 [Bradyrhizobium sp.]|nr:hypothetical protein [Bradyrhizobium sp.]